MGWLMIDKPGKQDGIGPCEPICKHEDCIENRALVEKACTLCGKPIGFDTKFYIDDGGAKHAVCVWSRRGTVQR